MAEDTHVGDVPRADVVQVFGDAAPGQADVGHDDAIAADAYPDAYSDAWYEVDSGSRNCEGLARSETRIRELMADYRSCQGYVDCTVLIPSINCDGTPHNPDQLVAVNVGQYDEASAALEAATPELCEEIGSCIQRGDYIYPGVACIQGRCEIDTDACPTDFEAAAGWWCTDWGMRCESVTCGDADMCVECRVLTCENFWMLEHAVCD
jgi:hypothetical protein